MDEYFTFKKIKMESKNIGLIIRGLCKSAVKLVDHDHGK